MKQAIGKLLCHGDKCVDASSPARTKAAANAGTQAAANAGTQAAANAGTQAAANARTKAAANAGTQTAANAGTQAAASRAVLLVGALRSVYFTKKDDTLMGALYRFLVFLGEIKIIDTELKSSVDDEFKKIGYVCMLHDVLTNWFKIYDNVFKRNDKIPPSNRIQWYLNSVVESYPFNDFLSFFINDEQFSYLTKRLVVNWQTQKSNSIEDNKSLGSSNIEQKYADFIRIIDTVITLMSNFKIGLEDIAAEEKIAAKEIKPALGGYSRKHQYIKMIHKHIGKDKIARVMYQKDSKLYVKRKCDDGTFKYVAIRGSKT
jgi:hypothetical protein